MGPKTPQVLRTIFAFILAVGVGYVVATLLFTSANLIRLSAVGADIAMSDAWRTLIFDLGGMMPSPASWTNYGSLMFIGFAIAFAVAALLRLAVLRSPAWQRVVPILFPLAGAIAIGVILLISYSKYEVFMLAGARGAWGATAQCLTGALAGYLFQVSLAKREERQ
jgi:hypothetical protein